MLKHTKYLLFLFLPFASFEASQPRQQPLKSSQQRIERAKNPQECDESYIEHSSEDEEESEASNSPYGGPPEKISTFNRLFSNEARKRRVFVRKHSSYIHGELLDKASACHLDEEDNPMLSTLITDHVSINQTAIQEAIVSNEKFEMEYMNTSLLTAIDDIIGAVSKEELEGFLARYKYHKKRIEDRSKQKGWRKNINIFQRYFINKSADSFFDREREKEIMRCIKLEQVGVVKKSLAHIVGVVETTFTTITFSHLKYNSVLNKLAFRETTMPLKDAVLDAEPSDLLKGMKNVVIGATLAWLASQIASSLGVEGLARLLMVSAALGAAAAVAGGVAVAVMVAIGIYVAYKKYKDRAKAREKQVPYIVSNWAKKMQEEGRVGKAVDGVKSHKGKLSALAIVAIIAAHYLVSIYVSKKKWRRCRKQVQKVEEEEQDMAPDQAL